MLSVSYVSCARPTLPSTCCRRCLCRLRVQGDLLHTPVEELAHEQLIFGGAGDFVNPAELLRLVPRLAEPSEHFAVERQFVDAAWIGIGAVEELLSLCVRWRDADRPRCARRHR